MEGQIDEECDSYAKTFEKCSKDMMENRQLCKVFEIREGKGWFVLFNCIIL